MRSSLDVTSEKIWRMSYVASVGALGFVSCLRHRKVTFLRTTVSQPASTSVTISLTVVVQSWQRVFLFWQSSDPAEHKGLVRTCYSFHIWGQDAGLPRVVRSLTMSDSLTPDKYSTGWKWLRLSLLRLLNYFSFVTCCALWVILSSRGKRNKTSRQIVLPINWMSCEINIVARLGLEREMSLKSG